MSKTLCPIPWNHLEIQQNGDYKICFICTDLETNWGRLEKDNMPASILNTSLDDARNLNLIKELRVSMLNGVEHELCKNCYNHEKIGTISKRQYMLAEYDGSYECVNDSGEIDTAAYPIKYLDIRFGNLCNLKCITCGPGYSSLWYSDFLKFHNTTSSELYFYDTKKYKIEMINSQSKLTTNVEDFSWYENNNSWDKLKSASGTIDRIYLTGGEPSLIKSHFLFLDYLIENGVSHNIKLEYNSNMVAIPDMLFDKWEKFKEVEIGCSVDGINDYANYIRHPSDWNIIEKNLDKIGYLNSTTIKGILAPTVSIFNIKHIIELIDWLATKRYTNILGMLSLNMLHGPHFLSIQVLPKNVKLEIIELYEKFFERILKTYGKTTSDHYKYYSAICNHMMSVDSSEHLPELAHYVYKMDSIRNTNIEKTIPWLHDILKNQPKFISKNI